MKWTPETTEIAKRLYHAIQDSEIEVIEKLCKTNPWLISDHTWQKSGSTWLKAPARKGNLQAIKALLKLGFDINALSGKEQSTALGSAVDCDHYELASYLLKNGADPNLSRPLIGALNGRKPPELQLAFAKLLVENGCDVNRLYDLYGDSSNQFTALDWANDPKVISYLKSVGAKTSEEISSGVSVGQPELDELTEVIQFFRSTFGEVDERSLIEIVPTGHPVAVNAIRPSGNRKHLTLFTTGLSSAKMNVPDGLENYALAELFIQLPGEWDFASSDPRWSWPVEWLRRIAQHPHDNKTWLGGPVTIIANNDPPEPLGPNTDFTSLMLVAEKSFKRSDGGIVQLYRVAPIYSDERELELKQGAPALMRAFDRNSVPFIVDLQRPSVASGV